VAAVRTEAALVWWALLGGRSLVPTALFRCSIGVLVFCLPAFVGVILLKNRCSSSVFGVLARRSVFKLPGDLFFGAFWPTGRLSFCRLSAGVCRCFNVVGVSVILFWV
jgi:hypothetical protein